MYYVFYDFNYFLFFLFVEYWSIFNSLYFHIHDLELVQCTVFKFEYIFSFPYILLFLELFVSYFIFEHGLNCVFCLFCILFALFCILLYVFIFFSVLFSFLFDSWTSSNNSFIYKYMILYSVFCLILCTCSSWLVFPILLYYFLNFLSNFWIFFSNYIFFYSNLMFLSSVFISSELVK